MLSQADKKLPWVLTDMASATAAMAGAFAVRFSLMESGAPVGGLGYHLLWALAFSPVFALINALLGVYSAPPEDGALTVLGRLLTGNALGLMLVVDAVFLFRIVDFSRWMLVIWLLLTDLLTGLRVGLTCREARGQRRPMGVVLIGSGPAAEDCRGRLRSSTAYRLLGSVHGRGEPAADDLGGLPDLPALLRRAGARRAVIVPGPELPDVGEVLCECERAGVQPYLLPAWNELLGSRAYIEPMEGMAVVNLRRIPLDDPGAEVVKRLGDVFGAAALLALTAPVMLAAAIGTRLTSPGPVIFAQERLGRDRQPFKMLKFRTMAVGSDAEGWTTADDPRRTRFGAFLRRWSVDELPQLINVLRGEMSLVGPRPEMARYAERFCRSIPLYMVRHRVRPGITGWAQIHGLRGDTSIPRRVEHDLWYIENWSPLLDVKILLLTPFRGVWNPQERPMRQRVKTSGKRKRAQG